MDSVLEGFDCVKEHGKLFRSWEEGKDLQCISPMGLEEVLKACKAHRLIPMTLCMLNEAATQFVCLTPDHLTFTLALKEADNYACLNELDKRRMLERCK